MRPAGDGLHRALVHQAWPALQHKDWQVREWQLPNQLVSSGRHVHCVPLHRRLSSRRRVPAHLLTCCGGLALLACSCLPPCCSVHCSKTPANKPSDKPTYLWCAGGQSVLPRSPRGSPRGQLPRRACRSDRPHPLPAAPSPQRLLQERVVEAPEQLQLLPGRLGLRQRLQVLQPGRLPGLLGRQERALRHVPVRRAYGHGQVQDLVRRWEAGWQAAVRPVLLQCSPFAGVPGCCGLRCAAPVIGVPAPAAAPAARKTGRTPPSSATPRPERAAA